MSTSGAEEISFSVRVGLPNSPLRLALLCPITIFVTSESLTYSEICSDPGAEPLCELYVLRKSGLILIIYDRIRLHIDGGKSCMKDLSHLCGGVYNPCIGRRRG